MFNSDRGLENQRLTHSSLVCGHQLLLEHMVGMNGHTNIEQLLLVGRRKEILSCEHALNLLASVTDDGRSRQIFTMRSSSLLRHAFAESLRPRPAEPRRSLLHSWSKRSRSTTDLPQSPIACREARGACYQVFVTVVPGPGDELRGVDCSNS